MLACHAAVTFEGSTLAKMKAMSRSGLVVPFVFGLLLALAGFLAWAVLAGGYREGVVIPAALVLGLMVGGLRIAWARGTQRPGASRLSTADANRITWALIMFVLGVLMGWLCAELVGFLLLPILWVVIVPRARTRGLMPITLSSFGLGFVLLPLYFLAVDSSGGFSWPLVLWFTPEVVIGGLLLLPCLRRSTHRSDEPSRIRR